MAERRSLGEAIITPEKLAFIKGAEGKAPSPAENVTIIETSVGGGEELKPAEKRSKVQRRASPRQDQAPEPTEVLNQMLVSVTNRFQHRTAQALKRAHLERKLKSIQPNTQQEIVEIAVQDWLRDHGYLD